MNRICLLIILMFFCDAVNAQVLLHGTDQGNNIRSLDSTGLTASEVARIAMDSTRVIILSPSDTKLMMSDTYSTFNKKACLIDFLGCDETHRYTSEFMNYFYSEYLETNNNETAFFNAKKYLLNKYPECPVTPVMKCGT